MKRFFLGDLSSVRWCGLCGFGRWLRGRKVCIAAKFRFIFNGLWRKARSQTRRAECHLEEVIEQRSRLEHASGLPYFTLTL
ncbi:hypothetical protein PS910_04373 [Pseudomonas fluorescens]|nr:hypothetical protein PS910_04373 [Pseudomonas fluorescens]